MHHDADFALSAASCDGVYGIVKGMKESSTLVGVLVLVVLVPGCDRTRATPPKPAESPTPEERGEVEPTRQHEEKQPDEAVGVPSADVHDDDVSVVPFEGVGPIGGDTTRGELSALFDESRLEDAATTVGEGLPREATTVDLGEGQSVEIIWKTGGGSVESIRIMGDELQTPEGIGIGTTLEELREILGEFDVIGFEVSGAGLVFLEGTELEHYHGGLRLHLEATEPTADHYREVMGFERFSSSNSHLQAVRPVVAEMAISPSFPERDRR